MSLLKAQVTALLEEIADLLEVQAENPFSARAFRNAARALESFPGDLESLLEGGRLGEVPGIGASTGKEIVELAQSGSSRRLQELRSQVPRGLLDLLRVPGLGPKKARVLATDLGIDGLEALKAACAAGTVAKLKGFGEKTQARIVEGIEYIGSVAGQFRVDEALPRALRLLEHLRGSAAVTRAELAGSLRRGKETVKDVDLVAGSASAAAVMEHFVHGPGVAQVILQGDTKTSVRLANGLQADLRVVADGQYPAALQYFSGSKEHNTALRGLARENGLKLNEYGLFRGEEPLPLRDEAAIYEALGLQYIEPELREDMGELELARTRRLPRLLEQGDLRGVVHVHSDWSDGAGTLEEMVEAARERGYTYLGITDHSQSAAYAGGLTPEQVRKQHAEIDRLNARLRGFRIFKGIESDIRIDGSLDYDPETLDLFDFVVASVHSGFHLDERAMTERVVRALGDPHTTFLGHPTGRLLLQRDGFAIDMDRVLRAAADHGVAVEINADPHRLDLDWRLGPRARELGVLTGIHPDAHSTGGIDNVAFGVRIARKAGFTREQTVNARTADEFEAHCRSRRR